MKRLVLLFSHQLTKKQELDAKEGLKCSEILYMPKELKEKWQNLGMERELNEFKDFLKEVTTIGDYVLVQGEWGATYEMVNYCKENNLIPIYSSTKREVEEKKEGETIVKISKFVHRGFVQY
ncbi:CRISPR-associated protein Csx20 [Fusobacterium sp.]|uniref:CRISPR-associated protein Csx20 n=1 Tax=Fusobacterium sp. TaxID=68766 RepID=UPI00261F956E|nr:CRISPR-associated protein Csx20 [Fusobacterium sp.]